MKCSYVIDPKTRTVTFQDRREQYPKFYNFTNTVNLISVDDGRVIWDEIEGGTGYRCVLIAKKNINAIDHKKFIGYDEYDKENE